MGCSAGKEQTKEEASPAMLELEEKERVERTAILEAYWRDLRMGCPFTLDKAAKHNTKEDLWIIVHDCLFDGTKWLNGHPGGPKPLLSNGGVDSTKQFDIVHSKTTKATIGPKHKCFLARMFPLAAVEGFDIGLDFASAFEKPQKTAASPTESPQQEAISTAVAGGIAVDDFTEVEVSRVFVVTHNTKKITVSFANKEFVLPMLPGGHVSLEVPATDEAPAPAYRSYSPVVIMPGKIIFTVKLYPGGRGSGYLHSRTVGDRIRLRGPIAPIFDFNEFIRKETSESPPRLLLIAAGTGAAPILTIVQALIKNNGAHQCAVVMCFRRREEALFVDEIRALQGATKQLTAARFFFSQEPSPGAVAADEVMSRVSEDALREMWTANMGRPVDSGRDVVVICGPPPFNDACEAMAAALGFAGSNLVVMD